MSLSEQAKIASLQEEIREMRSRARLSAIVSMVGIAMVVYGFGFYFFQLADIFSLIVGILGVVFAIVGLVFEYMANAVKKSLMSELAGMAIRTPKCSKCEKELPQGNFAFCPFCGNSVKSN